MLRDIFCSEVHANVTVFQKTTRTATNMTLDAGRYPSVSTVLGCTTSQQALYRWQLKMVKQLGGIGQFKRYMRSES